MCMIAVYTMLDVFKEWKFDGKISLGVIDQRIDSTETEEDIINAIKPALEYFPKEKILLTKFITICDDKNQDQDQQIPRIAPGIS